MARGADECFYDVRDRDLTWEESAHCQSLRALAQAYVELGGFSGRDEVDSVATLTAERARSAAWMARATSLAPGQSLSIW